LAYVDRLKRFFRDKPVAELVGNDLISAAHAICAGPKGNSNANKNRSVITPASSILHYAAEQGWCPERRFRRLAVSRRSNRRPVSSDTMRLLLANTSGHKHLLLAWLYETGQRISDTLRLQRADLDLPRAIARVGSEKTDDHGQIELSPELVAMLANAPHLPSGRVFPWGDRHNVYRWLKPLCADLGVTYTPHQSRHAMATDLRALGYDMRSIAERGLWRDERSAGRYVHHRSSAAPDRGVVVLLRGDKK
jgi:integrase